MTEQRVIYPVERAIEHTTAIPDARPTRYFSLLLPMWCVEINATVRESQPYEVFDGFISRGIAYGRLVTPETLARFFGVEDSLVHRALGFLEDIRHVERRDDRLVLTDLGVQSVRDGCRYVLKEDRRKLYLDGFRSEPLPTSHYSGVTLLEEPSLQHFVQITSLVPFDNTALHRLLDRPDRRDYNIPDGLRDAKPLTTQQLWLPVYLIENAGTPAYFAFTGIAGDRDRHVESIASAVHRTLAAEPGTDPLPLWREWLARRGFAGVTPQRLSNGILRAVLPAEAFGRRDRGFELHQLGSFQPHKRLFMQLWCTDVAARREAVLHRLVQILAAGGMRTAAELHDRADQIARQLEVDAVTEAEVRQAAASRGNERAVNSLSRLGS